MIYISFAVIVALWAYMDHLDFHRPYNNGFFSLHTRGHRIDAWHVSKWIILGIITVNFVGLNVRDILAFFVISVVLHGVILHGVNK